MGALYLVRHGATSFNAETPGAEKLRGWLDIGLATAGVVIARSAARALQQVPFAKLYTSDLKRAHDTARIMSVTLGVRVDATKALRPWNLGQLAGQEIGVVKDQLTSLTNGKRNVPAPGGETFNHFLARWTDELRSLLHEAAMAKDNVLAVTHARNLYALEEILFRSPIPVKGPPHPGAVLKLDGDWGDVVANLVFAGDTGRDGVS